MAGAALAIVPVLVLFFIFQKQIVKSLSTSGLKGWRKTEQKIRALFWKHIKLNINWKIRNMKMWPFSLFFFNAKTPKQKVTQRKSLLYYCILIHYDSDFLWLFRQKKTCHRENENPEGFIQSICRVECYLKTWHSKMR